MVGRRLVWLLGVNAGGGRVSGWCKHSDLVSGYLAWTH